MERNGSHISSLLLEVHSAHPQPHTDKCLPIDFLFFCRHTVARRKLVSSNKIKRVATVISIESFSSSKT